MIQERDKNFIDYWRKKRTAGRWAYSFRHGVLYFAWPVFFGSEFFRYLTDIGHYLYSWSRIAIGFSIWTFFGMLAFGLIMWWTQERRYQNLIKKESD